MPASKPLADRVVALPLSPARSMAAMATGEFAEVSGGRRRGLRFASLAGLRPYALGLYFVALILWSAHYGIPVQRELVILWTCGALACASIGRPPREILRLVVDCLPLVALLWASDAPPGAADTFGIGVHHHLMIDFDRAIFGEVPTVWLQQHLHDPG